MSSASKKTTRAYTPTPLFDKAECLKTTALPTHLPDTFAQDYEYAKQFLLSYQYNAETFKSFRRDIERFAQYCWFVEAKPLSNMSRTDIEAYLLFCQKPPISWIGTTNVARFKTKDDVRYPNKKWRPFVATLSKSDRQQGKTLHRDQYRLSEKGFREIFTILNCYYNFLIQEEISEINPILQIKQKNRFYRSHQSKPKIRRVSSTQWQTIIETAKDMADKNPDKHARTLFIMSMLYGMYLRISELTASDRWTPTMNDFEKDHTGSWWFTTVGKGNKERRVAVSDSMLEALKRWRELLNLAPLLPLPNDNSPLIPKQLGHGAITDTSHVRRLVQACFDKAIAALQKKGLENDAQELSHATVHWLRHTGISDDVKNRPREHVRDDAGHSSSSITDKYIDINLHERHASASDKTIMHSPMVNIPKTAPISKETQHTQLGPNDLTEKTITLKMDFHVENNSKFVRGKGQSLKDIEDRIFSHHDIEVLDKDAGRYEITLHHTNYLNLDEQLQGIASEAESIADYRNGFIEFDVYTFDGDKVWPFSHHIKD